jgi:signal transduction histidine kinase
MGLFSNYPRKSTLSRGDLESLVSQRTAELQALSQRLLRVQDEERRRIARDLHDSAGQTLTALKISIALLQRNSEQDQCTSRALCDIVALADQALQEIRTTSYLLHPPLLDELGFVSAAQWFLEGFAKRSGIKVKLDFERQRERLPVLIETALFRVLQESLTNVHRHSGSSEVEVRFQNQAEQIMLEIRDLGRGIPRKLLEVPGGCAAAGVGLAGMRERMTELNGKLEITSNGRGTSLCAIIPVPALIRFPKFENCERRSPSAVRHDPPHNENGHAQIAV